MRLPTGLSIFRFFSERTRRPSWVPSSGGREGVQNGRLQAQEEAGRGAVPRHENLGDIAKSVSVKAIVIAVSREADIPTEVMLGRGRKHALARWRHLMFLLAYELSHQSLMQIGKAATAPGNAWKLTMPCASHTTS